MINRYPIVAFCLTVVLLAYLAFSLPATAEMARNDHFTACHINVVDSMHTGFIDEADISTECGGIKQWISQRRRKDVSLMALESKLRESDRIETVNVSVHNDGSLAIDVVPMVPVARVFDVNASYYINSEGKRISADPHYHVDVPVVVGHFPANRTAARLLPLLDYITNHDELNALVSTVKQERNGDIIIVPNIRGHVVNFGDTAHVTDKFERLMAFYRKVMPQRGWELYDTVSVKWNGSIVATRRNKALNASLLAASIEEYEDIDDVGTMETPLHNDSTTIQ